jgi:hypothetical protein
LHLLEHWDGHSGHITYRKENKKGKLKSNSDKDAALFPRINLTMLKKRLKEKGLINVKMDPMQETMFIINVKTNIFKFLSDLYFLV